MQILYSFLRYTDRLLDVFFLLLAVILSELMRNQEGKMELHKTVHKRICVKDITFFWLHALLLMSFFVVFFHLLPPFCLLRFYLEKIILLQKMGFFIPFLYGAVTQSHIVCGYVNHSAIFKRINPILEKFHNRQE